MSQLSTLEVRVELGLYGASTGKLVRINHPSLKSVTLSDPSEYANFEIDCPNLTDLSMAEGETVGDSRKAVQLAIKLQHQLQSLAVFIRRNQQWEMLTNADLSNLKKLHLQTSNISYGIERLFNRMENLIELHLSSDRRSLVTVDEALGVLVNLMKLTLTSITVDIEGFEEALRTMEQLRDLILLQCCFTPPKYSWQIVPDHFKNLTIDWTGCTPGMLPLCRQLKSLKLTTCSKQPDDIFVDICDSYPELEKLYFDPGFKTHLAEFHSSTSFWHIKQLRHLKELHVVGLYLKDLDWTVCRGLAIEKLRLDHCGLYENEVMEDIFEFLTFSERMTVSLTCTAWYQLAFSRKFCRTMCISIRTRTAAYEDIRAYQNYRKARVWADITVRNQSSKDEFFRAAPLESLMIYGEIASLDTLLDEHLLSMKHLTTLHVKIKHLHFILSNSKNGSKKGSKVLRISHPSLKAIKIDGDPGGAKIELDCPNLTDLNLSETEIESKEVVKLVIKLQQQLQSLDVFIYGDQSLEMLANAQLSNLKTLRLHFDGISNDLETFFNRMEHLVELHLRGVYRIGEELGVLTSLSKLNLYRMAIDTAGFEKALCQMTELKDLNLDQCEFEPPTRSWHIASKKFRNLLVDWREHCLVMLPHCKKLKSLQLTITTASIDDIFVQVCNFYPQLEKLYFKVILPPSRSLRSLWVEFRSSTSFSHITKLKCLKDLQLLHFFLKDADWPICSAATSIEKLQLDFCKLQLSKIFERFRSFGPGLRQLHLKYCCIMTASGTLMNDAKCVESLRKVMPWCRIASDFYKRSDGNCSSDELDGLILDYDN